MKLSALTTVLRSKNAGPFLTTFDVFFDDEQKYAMTRDSGVLNAETIAECCHTTPDAVVGPYFVDAVLGIKITLRKPAGYASGEPRCSDSFGAQQYVPLMELEIPERRQPGSN